MQGCDSRVVLVAKNARATQQCFRSTCSIVGNERTRAFREIGVPAAPCGMSRPLGCRRLLSMIRTPPKSTIAASSVRDMVLITFNAAVAPNALAADGASRDDYGT